jgi:hypothetical protein
MHSATLTWVLYQSADNMNGLSDSITEPLDVAMYVSSASYSCEMSDCIVTAVKCQTVCCYSCEMSDYCYSYEMSDCVLLQL